MRKAPRYDQPALTVNELIRRAAGRDRGGRRWKSGPAERGDAGLDLEFSGVAVVLTLARQEAGLVLEPGLVEGMLHDVVGEPGALPMLSHSLVETWQRRSGRTLTLLG